MRNVAEEPKVPEFMKDDLGAGLENLGPEDVAWMGEAGELDDARIASHEDQLSNPHLALFAVVQAIVAQHPDGNSDTDARVHAAMKALIGVEGARALGLVQGRHEEDDSEILRAMAREYFLRWYRFKNDKLDLSRIYEAVADGVSSEALFAKLPRSDAVKQTRLRTLRSKFRDRKDLLLIEAFNTSELLAIFGVKQRSLISALRDLGLITDGSTPRPAVPRAVARRG